MEGAGRALEESVELWMRNDLTYEELEKEAVSAGLDSAKVEQTIDACPHDARRDVIKLILSATAAQNAASARVELLQLKTLGEIKSRAETWGVNMDELKKAIRTTHGNPKAAAVDFIFDALALGYEAPTPRYYKVIAERGAIVRAGIDKASDKVGEKVAADTIVEVSELKRTTTGTLRARTKDGWVTAVTKTGKDLLVETEEVLDAEESSGETATVPEGYSGGDTLSVEVDGEEYFVVVPDGLGPGDTFPFELVAADEPGAPPQLEPEPEPEPELSNALGATPAMEAPTPQTANTVPVQPEPAAAVLTASAPGHLESVMSEEDSERLAQLQGMTGDELKRECNTKCAHLKSGTARGWEQRGRIMAAIEEGATEEAAVLIMWAWKDGEAQAAGDLRRQFSYGSATRQEQQVMSGRHDLDTAVMQKKDKAATKKAAEDDFAEKILSRRKIDKH